MIKPSDFHSNKRAHNWLIYDIGDKYLIKYSKFFNGDVVDLGAGSSPYKNFILSTANSYTAVDWSKSLYETNLDIIADLNDYLPLDSDKYDTVLSFSVLEHLKEPQLHLNEAYRICKNGGKIFIQVPFQWAVHEAPYDYFRFTKYGLQYILGKAGFVDIKIEAQAGFFTTLSMKINYFGTRFLKGPKFVIFIIKNFFLKPLWFLTQISAPILDLFDRTWATEASGYCAIAFKRKS